MIAGGIAISRWMNRTFWKALGLLAIFFAVSIIAIGAIAVGIVAISSMPSSRSTGNDSPKFGDAWNENKSGSLTSQSSSNANSGDDATVVMGVNTAGVQRVNKLANLQAMLIRALPPGADEAKSIWSESKAHGDANVSSRISESFGSHGFMWH